MWNRRSKKVLNLLILLIATCLAAVSFTTRMFYIGMGSTITALVSLGTLLKLEHDTLEKIEEMEDELKRKTREADQKLYEEFISTLPSDSGSIIHLKDHPFASGYENEYLSELRDFVHYWDNAQHEFLDQKVEESRRNLLDASYEFLGFLAKNFASSRKRADLLLPIHKHNPNLGQEKERELIEKCDKLQDKVLEKYKTFIRTAKERLAV